MPDRWPPLSLPNPVDGAQAQPHRHDAGDISGTFTDIKISGDIWSTNWNGAIPAHLELPDPAGTTGFYLDGSAGIAQFAAIRFSKLTVPDMVLTISGDHLRWEHTGVGGEGPYIYGFKPVGYTEIVIGSGYRNSVTAVYSQLHLWDWDVGDPNTVVFELAAHVVGDPDPDRLVSFSLTPSIIFSGDDDSYLAYGGADNWHFFMGGHEVLDLSHDQANLCATTVQLYSQTVSFGANDSAGAGYRHVRVPNA
jgi:hypothetical protein